MRRTRFHCSLLLFLLLTLGTLLAAHPAAAAPLPGRAQETEEPYPPPEEETPGGPDITPFDFELTETALAGAPTQDEDILVDTATPPGQPPQAASATSTFTPATTAGPDTFRTENAEMNDALVTPPATETPQPTRTLTPTVTPTPTPVPANQKLHFNVFAFCTGLCGTLLLGGLALFLAQRLLRRQSSTNAAPSRD